MQESELLAFLMWKSNQNQIETIKSHRCHFFPSTYTILYHDQKHELKKASVFCSSAQWEEAEQQGAKQDSPSGPSLPLLLLFRRTRLPSSPTCSFSSGWKKFSQASWKKKDKFKHLWQEWLSWVERSALEHQIHSTRDTAELSETAMGDMRWLLTDAQLIPRETTGSCVPLETV